jgi:hypothetical protein
MKTMIWIDDAAHRLKQLSGSLLPVLWEHDVCSRMILVGNNYKAEQQEANRDLYIDELYADIKNLFYRFCYERKKNKTLDEYYEKKKNIIPREPKNLPENSSCDDVIKTFDEIVKDNENGDTLVVGIDIMLNKDDPGGGKTLTDEILEKLSGGSNIKIFIYSFYDPNECPPNIKAFMKRHTEFDIFLGQDLVTKDSKERKNFLEFFGIRIEENGDLTKQ